jgi:hypothetical protein
MRYLFFIFSFTLILSSQLSYSQNTYSLGAKGGFGFNAPSVNATLITNSNSYNLRNNVFFSGGVLGQYLLGDLFGIETGILMTYQTYARKDLVSGSIKNFLGWNNSVGIHDYQIPIQLIYKIKHPTNPYRHFKITAGASLDWLTTEYLKKPHNSLFISNLLLGIRMGNQKGKRGRIECGLEYQYTIGGRYNFNMKTDKGIDIFNAKYSVLSFNLYYFFLNRDIKQGE